MRFMCGEGGEQLEKLAKGQIKLDPDQKAALLKMADIAEKAEQEKAGKPGAAGGAKTVKFKGVVTIASRPTK